MESEETPARHKKASARRMHDANLEQLHRAEREIHKLQVRNAQLETALTRASATARVTVRQTEAENQRRTINDSVREALITSLQSENKNLLLQLDEDALDLATKEARLRDLSMELILAHEKEQRRIARELHDEVGQELTALRMVVSRAIAAEPHAVKALLAEVSTISDVLLKTVRGICTTLRPQVLDDLGLVAGLSVHLHSFGARSGLTINFEHGSINEAALPPIVQSVVFRVVQEAITNVARHAKCKTARVTIAMEGPSLTFTIQDSGCGFDAEALWENPSTGLSCMVERLLLLNGSCLINSKPRKGTTITARIPLLAKA